MSIPTFDVALMPFPFSEFRALGARQPDVSDKKVLHIGC
jgi:hypothetical protein